MPEPLAPKRPSPARRDSDWPAQVTNAIVDFVDSIKGKTTGPATSAARTVVYGLLAAIVGIAALALVLALVLRGIDVGVDALLDQADIDREGRSTWIAHTIIGLGLLGIGFLIWRKGIQPDPD